MRHVRRESRVSRACASATACARRILVSSLHAPPSIAPVSHSQARRAAERKAAALELTLEDVRARLADSDARLLGASERVSALESRARDAQLACDSMKGEVAELLDGRRKLTQQLEKASAERARYERKR